MTGERYTLQRRALNNAWRWVDVMSSDSLDELLAQARGEMRIYDRLNNRRQAADTIRKRNLRQWRER